MSTAVNPRQREELNELKRIAAARILENAAAGRGYERTTLRWARMFCATHKPLGRPLGTGTPEGR